MPPKNFFVGEFATLEALWARLPNGGVEGEYARINGVEYAWDKYERNWKSTNEQNSGNTGGTTPNSGNGSSTTGTNGSTTDGCGCQQIVNVYCGCGNSNSGNCDELREQVENNLQQITELRELIETLGDSDSSSATATCSCRPQQLTLAPSDWCSVEYSVEDLLTLGIIEQSEQETDETTNGMSIVSDGYIIPRDTQIPGIACARISLPDGAIENRMIGIYINGQYSILTTKSLTGGTGSNENSSQILPILD